MSHTNAASGRSSPAQKQFDPFVRRPGVPWAAIALGDFLLHRRGPQALTPIFAGVTYRAERIASTEEGGGLLHVVTVDLAAPGIELYVTPLDPKAVAQGWQYRLRRIGDVLEKEHLAVAINGALFTSRSPWWFRMSGDLAKGVETVVADHVVSHVWEHNYLLWFDDQLAPNVGLSRPPTSVELRSGEMGNWRPGGLVAGWQGLAWQRPQAGLADGGGD